MLDRAADADRPHVNLEVVEDGRRDTIQPQHVLIGRSRPAARFDLCDYAPNSSQASRPFAASTLSVWLQDNAQGEPPGRTPKQPCREHSHENRSCCRAVLQN